MQLGAQTLERGANGPEVVELQLHLAGFRGTVWDGEYGPGTELQVIAFQQDYLSVTPTGVADEHVFQGLKRFAQEFPIDFEGLMCPCGECGGFGDNLYRGQYAAGRPPIERFHRYEYPGLHKAILHSLRAAQFYAWKNGLGFPYVTSAYRCWRDNNKRRRTTTNHMGKALDIDFPARPDEDKEQDRGRCDVMRAMLVEKCGFQIGWGAENVKALEPAHIAPTWVHMDVRCYASLYLSDEHFVKSANDLDLALSDIPGSEKWPPTTATANVSGAESTVNIAAILSGLDQP